MCRLPQLKNTSFRTLYTLNNKRVMEKKFSIIVGMCSYIVHKFVSQKCFSSDKGLLGSTELQHTFDLPAKGNLR